MRWGVGGHVGLTGMKYEGEASCRTNHRCWRVALSCSVHYAASCRFCFLSHLSRASLGHERLSPESTGDRDATVCMGSGPAPSSVLPLRSPQTFAQTVLKYLSNHPSSKQTAQWFGACKLDIYITSSFLRYYGYSF